MAASVLQTSRKHSLGRDWTVSFLTDGSASFFDASTSKYIHLPRASVETLRSAFRDEGERHDAEKNRLKVELASRNLRITGLENTLQKLRDNLAGLSQSDNDVFASMVRRIARMLATADAA